MAWLEEDSSRCDCGQPRSESMAPENEGAYVGTALRCHACAERAAVGKRMSDAGGDVGGLYIAVSRA